MNAGGSGLSACLLDHADGVCSINPDVENKIVVRSTVIDGNVLFDHGTLMHELGHAFDYLARDNLNPPNYLHQQEVMITAFTKEKGHLAAYYQSHPTEFVAEVFARYSLDRTRTKRLFPMAVAGKDYRAISLRKIFHFLTGCLNRRQYLTSNLRDSE